MATRKESLLLVLSTLIAVAGALHLLRWLAPELVGAPVDLRLTQASEEVVPFFPGVFRRADLQSETFLVNDPEVVSRARPLVPDLGTMGPNDLLGFRNRDVPVVADIVTIGDSQTYGNNAPLELNWPSVLETRLDAERDVRVYNMSVGAWGSMQYLEMIEYARHLQPRAIVVAFYTGNDPLTDFSGAYGNPAWARFRPDDDLDAGHAPRVKFPPPEDEHWAVTFTDGSRVTFTPGYRLGSNNRDEAAVRAGYRVMARAASHMRDAVRAGGALPVFTIIPTKEWVFARRIESMTGLDVDPLYARLVRDETRNIEELATHLAALDEALYVDVATPLSEAAMARTDIYPPEPDGHPLWPGYEVIGNALAHALSGAVPAPLDGMYGFKKNTDGTAWSVYLVRDNRKWLIPDPAIWSGCRELVERVLCRACRYRRAVP